MHLFKEARQASITSLALFKTTLKTSRIRAEKARAHIIVSEMSRKTRMAVKVLLCLRFRQLMKTRVVQSLRVHRKNCSINSNLSKSLLMTKVQSYTCKTVNFIRQTCHRHNTCLRKTMLGR